MSGGWVAMHDAHSEELKGAPRGARHLWPHLVEHGKVGERIGCVVVEAGPIRIPATHLLQLAMAVPATVRWHCVPAHTNSHGRACDMMDWVDIGSGAR